MEICWAEFTRTKRKDIEFGLILHTITTESKFLQEKSSKNAWKDAKRTSPTQRSDSPLFIIPKNTKK